MIESDSYGMEEFLGAPSDEELLESEIQQHGSLEACPWGTIDGRKMTMGEMTDDHLDNCIVYHKGLKMMGEVDNNSQLYRSAKYIEFKMRRLKESRKQKEQK